MSGLYNALFGRKDEATTLVDILQEIQRMEVGRFRDAWVELDGDKLSIRIHTRTGGGNRDGYQEHIASMQAHPWYERDEDMPLDTTYADFYFTVPENFEPSLRNGLLGIAQEPVDMNAKWQEMFDALDKKANG